MSESQTSISVEDQKVPVESKELSWFDLGIHSYIKIFIIGALIILFFKAELYRIAYRWFTDSSWSHGILIPLFSLYLLHQKKREILTLTPETNYFGLFFLLFFTVLYPLNVAHFQIGYLKSLLIIPVIGSAILLSAGWKALKFSWLPVCYLVFAFPIPDRIYKALTIPMRQWAAGIATVFLNFVKDMDASSTGVIINVMYKGRALDPPLDVAEACSGMRLLMAFLALGVAMAYIHYRPIWQRIVLLCSTIPIAIFCNVVRVTTTGFIYILIAPKYAQGAYHDALGLFMLPLALMLYYLLAWLMENIFTDEEPIKEDVIVRNIDKEVD